MLRKQTILTLLSLLPFSFMSARIAPAWTYPCRTWKPTLNLKEEKHITVIIPSYKNAEWHEPNLASVFAQKYSNYHVVYIDDRSPDKTADLVYEYVDKEKQQDRFTLIRNEKRMGALSNIYRAVHAADSNDIIVTLDGDDWFAHYHVFQMLNEAYDDSDVWMTYGQFALFPQYIVGFCREIPKEVIELNAYRRYLWSTSHLRTFYAWLFQEIKLEDLMTSGKFYPMAWDLAFMFPMLEMCHGKFKFLPHVNYLYNIATTINDHKVNLTLQTDLGHEVGRKKPYSQITTPTVKRSEQDGAASLVIFSYNRPMQLYALLESIDKYVAGLESISVLYRADNDRFATAYEKVKNSFVTLADSMTWQRQENPPHDFKPALLSLIEKLPSKHVIFAVDDIVVKDNVDLRDCVHALERTKAYAFYLRLGGNINKTYNANNALTPLPNHVELENDMLAWQFHQGQGDWAYPHNVDMTLYRRADIAPVLRGLSYHNPNTLEMYWANLRYTKDMLGLCYRKSKIVNIPVNLVNESWRNPSMNSYTVQELLEKFEQGEKLDILPLYQVDNSSVHMDHEFGFVGV